MKSSVAVAMIVCGTVLIALPYLHNAIAMQQLTTTMAALNKPVSLTSDIPKYVHSVCVIGGIIMILVGAMAGLRSGKSD